MSTGQKLTAPVWQTPLPAFMPTEKYRPKKETFYLIYSEDRLCIYRGDDKIFYDYADVAVNLMPVEIREQLKYGLYITGEQELYEFLQTYSS